MNQNKWIYYKKGNREFMGIVGSNYYYKDVYTGNKWTLTNLTYVHPSLLNHRDIQYKTYKGFDDIEFIADQMLEQL
jgi:hypothetical protein